MTKAEELKGIINAGEDVVPFLKTLNKAEGKALLPTLLELRQIYNRRVENRHTNPGFGPWKEYFYPMVHLNAVHLAGVVCADTVTQFRENVEWFAEGVLLSDQVIEKILPWHKPKWYQRTLNRTAIGVGVMDYEKLLLLMHKEYLRPSDELITVVFEASACRIKRGEGRAATSKISYELLRNNKEVLSEHFWLLFEHVSAINNRHEREEHNWFRFIPDFIHSGMVAKERVLKACLLACTKGFNRTQTAWYYKLFQKLKPSKEELLILQPELLTCLNATESSAINCALTAMQSILNDQKFEVQSFIESSSTLLSLPTKSIVNKVLTLLDKVSKKYPSFKGEVVVATIGALASEDSKIQLKAAKYLKKNIEPSEEYINAILLYQAGFLSETKEVLSEYLQEDEQNLEDFSQDFESEKLSILSDENKIPIYSTFDDIVFFLTQINQRKEYWHGEQLLVILPKLEKMITEENADKLSQAFTHGMNLVSSSSGWGTSSILSIYGCFINDLAEKIDKKYPGALKGRNKSIERLRKIHESYAPPFKTLMERKGNNLPTQRMILAQTKYCQSLMDKGLDVEILSVPTHLPGWIDPTIFVNRIIELESHGEPVNILDWQMAIMRLCPEIEWTTAFDERLNRINDGVLKNVIRYFYKQDELKNLAAPEVPYFLPAIICVGNKTDQDKLYELKVNNVTAAIHDYHWAHNEIEYLGWEYDRILSKSVRAVLTKDVLHVKEHKYKRPTKVGVENADNKGILNKIKGIFSKPADEPQEILEILNAPLKKRSSFFDYYDFMSDNILARKNTRNTVHLTADSAKRFLSMVPNRQHLYLSNVIHYNMERSDLDGEDKKRMVVAIVEFLISNWHKKDEHEITYAFLAASILIQDKMARQLVAELWIQAVGFDIFDSNQLGRIIGALLAKKYGPLKRLTDLISAFMTNLGPKYDRALSSLIQSTVAHMDKDPITNSKKLLEIFSELKINSNLPLDGDFQGKLAIWKETKSMQKVIKKILD